VIQKRQQGIGGLKAVHHHDDERFHPEPVRLRGRRPAGALGGLRGPRQPINKPNQADKDTGVA
jgi:hypothetical protein